MKKNKFQRVTMLNMVSSLLLQFVTIISGLILPRLILQYFGSNVNGLIYSLNQFLSFITLAEGGVTGVVLASLYKPLVERNNATLSSILVTAEKFYKKIGMFYVLYAILLGILYPLFRKTEFSISYILSLALILSFGLLIQYMLSLSLRSLLDADKRSYIISFSQIIITLLNLGITLLVIKLFPSIHLIKLLSSLLFLIQAIVYRLYVRKHYQINHKAPENTELLKNRWDGFAVNLAFFIHSSTDVVLLTLFMDLAYVSVYGVYFLVVSSLKSLLSSAISSLNPTIGQAYAKEDRKELHSKLNLYEYVDFLSVFFIFSVCALLLTPFVLLYTTGVHDANYIQPLCGYFLVLSEVAYLVKYPHLNLAYAANKFKEIAIPSYIESGINILVSLILIKPLGLIGIVIGTTCAMVYRMAFHVRFTQTMVPDRKPRIFYKKLCLFLIVSAVSILLCVLLYPFTELTVLQWILHGIVYSCIIGAILLAVSFLFFRDEVKYILHYITRR